MRADRINGYTKVTRSARSIDETITRWRIAMPSKKGCGKGHTNMWEMQTVWTSAWYFGATIKLARRTFSTIIELVKSLFSVFNLWVDK